MVPASSFPLLRLPKNATIVTLRIMNHLQLFGISLASNKTKSLVQSLKLRPFKITVYINHSFLIWLSFSSRIIWFQNFHSLPNRLEFTAEYEDFQYRWSSNNMDRRDFLDHLRTIFNTEKIKIEFGMGSHLFDFEPIFKGNQNIERINLRSSDPRENQRILNIIKPSKVSMNRHPSREILIQNIDSLSVMDMKISLDNFLLMNSRIFVTPCSPVPRKLLNRFLKLWMSGSNSQIECLKLSFPIDNSFSEEAIFSGLKITKNNTVRYFKSAKNTCKVTPGMDIFRFDGTMATIVVHMNATVCGVEMYVWHEHCIAEETH